MTGANQPTTIATIVLLALLSLLFTTVLVPIVSFSVRRNYVSLVRREMAGSGLAGPLMQAGDAADHPGPPAYRDHRELSTRATSANRAAGRAYLMAGLIFGLWSGAGIAGAFLFGGLARFGTGGASPALLVSFAILVVLVFAVLMAPLFGWLVVPTLGAIGLGRVRLRGWGWGLLAAYLVIVVFLTGGAALVAGFVLAPGALILALGPSGARGISWFVAPVCLALPVLAFGGLFALFGGLSWSLVGLLALVVAGTVARLWWVVGRYGRKRLSDDTLLISQWWFVQAMVLAAVPAIVSPWAGLATFAAYTGFAVTLSWRLRAIHRVAVGRPPVRLLLLRTFGHRRRSTRLLGVLSAHWRWIGSIQVIAGPDLAAATLEPHEFLDHLRGRMSGRFVRTRAEIGPRLAALDHEPDRDGRFRVNDVFCAGEVWRPTLQALLRSSHAVLIDLRGFGPQHAGVVFELEQLVGLSALDRVVAIVDSTTLKPFLDHVLVRAELVAGRSAGRARPHLVTVSAGGRPDMDRVFDALCRAAAPDGRPLERSAGQGDGERVQHRGHWEGGHQQAGGPDAAPGGDDQHQRGGR